MTINKETQVGIAVVLAIGIFWWGTRLLRDLPIFSEAHTYYTELVHTHGVISGSLVGINGVGVGSVRKTFLIRSGVRIEFSVHEDVVIPEGSFVSAGSPGIIGSAQLSITLGPADAPLHSPGAIIPGRQQVDLLGTLTASMPGVLSRADTALVATTETINAAQALLTQPDSDLSQTFASIRASADAPDGSPGCPTRKPDCRDR